MRRYGLRMHRHTTVLNRRWRQTGLLKEGLVSRMGIHIGEATVGTFGSHTRVEYTAFGRSVNLAAHLESACEPGRILVMRGDLAAIGRPHARRMPRVDNRERLRRANRGIRNQPENGAGMSVGVGADRGRRL